MLFLQSLAVAFQITWRALFFGTVYVALLAGFIYLFWYLAFLLVPLFSPVLIALYQLLMLRAGLAGRKMTKGFNLGRLIGASFKYGGFFWLLSLLLWFILLSLFYILDHYQDLGATVTGTGWFDWVEVPIDDGMLFMPPSLFVLAYFGNAALLWVFYSAMMVPMAARAHSCNTNAIKHDFFWGFGRGFLAIVCLQIFSLFIFAAFGFLLGFLDTTTIAAMTDTVSETSRIAILIGASLFTVLFCHWAASLPYGAAVILYQRMYDAYTARQKSDGPMVERMSPEDLRNMRKSR